MWRRRSAFVQRVLVLFDALVSVGAFWGALRLRETIFHPDASGPLASWLQERLVAFGTVPPIANPNDYQWLMLGLFPVWGFCLLYFRTGDLRANWRTTASRYARAVLLGLVLFIFVTFLFKLDFVARSFVALFAATQFVALLIGRAVTVPLANALRKNRSGGHRIVVVGSGARGVEFAGSLQRQHAHNVELLGFVSVPGEPNHVEARPNLGYVGSLAALLDRLPVDEVVFVVEGRHPDIFKEAIAACDARGVDVLLTLPPEYSTEAKLEIASVSGFDFPLLGLRRTPTGELELAVKRVMDFLGGTFGCVLAAPIMLLAAIAIKLESPGPVLFRQVRAGRNGRKFVMYKFRSMVIDAESQKATLMHLNEMGGPVFKIRQDPRITRVGRIIRKTSIDELPQFFNIIKGDMSMVGPRPPLPSEVEEYKPWQRRRLSVKPGLTGLWQVSGRNQVDFDEWMQLDLQYIDNWSLWLDIKILFQTIPVVLLHKGAS